MRGAGLRAQVAKLSCGCEKLYEATVPSFNDVILCRHHGPAKRVRAGTWKVRCQAPGCRYSLQAAGLGPIAAECKAARHGLTRGHSVRVWLALPGGGEEGVKLFGPKEQGQFEFDDIPPF